MNNKKTKPQLVIKNGKIEEIGYIIFHDQIPIIIDHDKFQELVFSEINEEDQVEKRQRLLQESRTESMRIILSEIENKKAQLLDSDVHRLKEEIMYLKLHAELGEVTQPLTLHFFESVETKKALFEFDEIAYLKANILIYQRKLDEKYEEDL